MVDVATLGISVNSNADKASADLKNLSQSAGQAEKSVTGLNAAADRGNTALNNSARTQQQLANATKLTADQYRNLGFQLNDVATGLLSGQSAFQIMAQQGGQVFQVLQGSQGGVVGALRGIGSQLSSIVTVGRLAFAGLAGGATAALLALNSYQDAQRGIQRGLIGQGARSGATADDVNRATAAGTQSGLSVSDSREATMEFVKNGNIRKEVLNDLMVTTRRFALVTEQSAQEAAAALAKSFGGGFEGISALNEKYVFLNAGTLTYVRTLAEQGRMSEAQSVAARSLAESLKGVEATLTPLERGWNAAKVAALAFFNATGKFINDAISAPLKEQQQTLQAVIAGYEKMGVVGELSIKMGGFREALKGVNDALAEQDKRAKEGSLNRIATDADAARTGLLPLEAKLAEIEARMRKIREGDDKTLDPFPGAVNPQSERALQAGEAEKALTNQRIAQQQRLNALVLQYAQMYPGISFESAKQLEISKAQLAVEQARSPIEKQIAEDKLRTLELTQQGAAAEEAARVAMAGRAVEQAKINEAAEQQLKSLQQQGELLKATSDYERDRVQFAITYQNLLDKQVDSLTALKIATQELRNTEQQRENQQREAAERQSRSSSSGNSQTIIYTDTAEDRSNREIAARNAERERRYQQYGSGSATGAGQTSTMDTGFTNSFTGVTGAEAITRAQEQHQKLIDEMTKRMTEALQNNQQAVEANTEALSVSLDPLFSQGHDYLNSLRIGYYKAATGLSGLVNGSGSGDHVPVNLMLEPGELVTVTPKNEVGKTGKPTSVQANDNRKYQTFNFIDGSTPLSRLTQRQRVQGY